MISAQSSKLVSYGQHLSSSPLWYEILGVYAHTPLSAYNKFVKPLFDKFRSLKSAQYLFSKSYKKQCYIFESSSLIATHAVSFQYYPSSQQFLLSFSKW